MSYPIFKRMSSFLIVACYCLLSSSSPANAQASYVSPISGKITLSDVVSPPAISINPLVFTFRSCTLQPTDANYEFPRNVSLSPDGSYSITDVPGDSYRVMIKGDKWLSKVIAIDNSNGPATASAKLLDGDATNDNAIDLGDFGVLVNAYPSDVHIAGSGYDPAADFNCDGLVDIADLGIIVNNYGMVGQSFDDITLTAQAETGPGGRIVNFSLSNIPGDPSAQSGSLTKIEMRCSKDKALSFIDSKSGVDPFTEQTKLIPIPAGSVLTTENLSTKVSWDYDNAMATFSIATSNVNFATSVLLTLIYTDENGQKIPVTKQIFLTPTRLWVSDVHMPHNVVLNWDTVGQSDSSLYTYTLERKGTDNTFVSYAVNFSDGQKEDNDPTLQMNANGSTTYRYQLIRHDAPNPNQVLASVIVTPYSYIASQNQTVDSRIDPRYDTPPFLDFQFGDRIYKGGLFCGSMSTPNPDNSRKGRSFAQFTFPSGAMPSGKTYLAGSSNAFYLGKIGADTQPVRCYALSNASNSWQSNTLVWSNSLPLMSSATTESDINLDTPNAWAHWPVNNSLRRTLLLPSNSQLSLAWTAPWDNSDGASLDGTSNWVYLAKQQYDAAKAPRITYALGTPILDHIEIDDLNGTPQMLDLTSTSNNSIYTVPGGDYLLKAILSGLGLGDSAIVSLSIVYHHVVNVNIDSGQPVETYRNDPLYNFPLGYTTLTGVEPGFPFSVANYTYTYTDANNISHTFYYDQWVTVTVTGPYNPFTNSSNVLSATIYASH